MSNILKNNQLIQSVITLIDTARQRVAQTINSELTIRYGRGFGKRNIHNFIKFNELYPDMNIVQTLSAQLRIKTMKIDNIFDDHLCKTNYLVAQKTRKVSVKNMKRV